MMNVFRNLLKGWMDGCVTKKEGSGICRYLEQHKYEVDIVSGVVPVGRT
jgi:hypothetical protein